MKKIDFEKKLAELNKINLAIIGHMGSGKSIFAKLIAKKLHLEKIDTDREICKKENLSINEIFELHGEKYFRKIEENIVCKSLNLENHVISLGGGSILSPKVRKKLNNNSYTIFLDTELGELEKRLSKSINRPLLQNNNILNKLKKLDTQRRKYYLEANIKIQNNDTVNKAYLNFIKAFQN